MRAAVFVDPGRVEIRDDVSSPTPAPGEVLLRVAACGICGSDMHLYRSNAHRGPTLLKVSPEGFEIPGHEYSGTVEAVGDGVRGFQRGDRVVGVTGGGGFAELVTVPVNDFQCVPIPPNVSFDEAATTEPLADALQMVRLAEIKPHENVVVIGVGIIGLGVIQVIRALGVDASRIIAMDVSETRRQMAERVGATHTLDPRTTSPLSACSELCGDVPSPLGTGKAPDVGVVFDCAGYVKHMPGPPPLQLALDILRPVGGRIICFGAYEGPVTLDLTYLIEKAPRVIGSLGYAAGELQQALELMASGRVDRRMLITAGFPLEFTTQAFETQGNGRSIKVLIHPNDPASKTSIAS